MNEFESVTARNGCGQSIENVSQSEDVRANFEGTGRLSLNVDESEKIFAQSQLGRQV